VSATKRDRLPLTAYAAGALAIVAVGLVGMRSDWIVERELLWIRGSAWCAILTLALTLCATPIGRVLVRLKRMTPARVTRVRRALGITTAALATLHATLALFTYLRGSWMHLLDLTWLRSGLIALAILVALWVTISGWTAFHDVRNENVFPLKPNRTQNVVEEFPRAPHERAAGLVFRGPGTFSDHHQFCFLISFTRNRIGSGRAQSAFFANANHLSQRVQGQLGQRIAFK
jgi:hypothetical protein